MKNIFKTLIPCLVLALGMSSCYDEMDDKDVVDAKYALANTPTVTMSSAAANDHASATVAASISTIDGVVESGFMVAESSDFSDAKAYIVENATSISTTLEALAELTTYYVKAYAFLGDGRLVYSEATSLTTLEAPSYELAGTYTATDYDASTGEADGTYEVTVEVNGSEVKITNFYDGGETVVGTYDAETQTVTIPTKQVIFVHSNYGDVWMMAIDSSASYIDEITCKFTPKGGFFQTSYWEALCGAGYFGRYWTEMSHK